MVSLIRSMVVGTAFGLLVTPTVQAQDKGKFSPEPQTGLEVGMEAPRFTLKDQAGRERSLDDLLHKGKVALVFYRSADW